MKEKILKVAIALAVISILPFVILITRREAPPEKIDVETHKEQVVKDFVLQSEGRKQWILKSPEALFEGEEKIRLKNPELTIYNGERILLIAKRAVYNQKEKTVNLEEVTITGKEFKGRAPYGVYYTEKENFITDSTCEITFDTTKRISGKSCQIDLRNKRVIIQSDVKSTFREVVK